MDAADPTKATVVIWAGERGIDGPLGTPRPDIAWVKTTNKTVIPDH